MEIHKHRQKVKGLKLKNRKMEIVKNYTRKRPKKEKSDKKEWMYR